MPEYEMEKNNKLDEIIDSWLVKVYGPTDESMVHKKVVYSPRLLNL